MFFSTLLLLLPFVAVTNAANDWSQPCITGQCSYDIPSNGTSSGTVTIWGSEGAISDITSAADWEILGCDANELSQSIRIVCKTPGSERCAHLFGDAGAVNKIIRLPENCGASAFARVSKSWIPEDQSIPASVARRIVRRAGEPAQVKALAFDTDFSAVDSSKTGSVNFAIQGANVPTAGYSAEPLNRVGPSGRSTHLSERGLFDFAKKAVKAVASVAKTVVGVAKAIVTNEVSANKSFDLKPVDFDKSVNLIKETFQCGAITAKINADLDATAHAKATISVAASGTIIPPKIKDFGVITNLDAQIDGSLTLDASVAGAIDSGKISVFSVGIPGLDFPGILTIGPSLDVNAQFSGSFEVDVNMKLALVLDVKDATIAFPPGTDANPADKAFSLGDTPLSISATPNVKATGTISAHLIPSINLGINALGGVAKATVHADLDLSASAKLTLEASADFETTVLDGKESTTAAVESATQKELPSASLPTEVRVEAPEETSSAAEATSAEAEATSSAEAPESTTEDVAETTTTDASETTTSSVAVDLPETTTAAAGHDMQPIKHDNKHKNKGPSHHRKLKKHRKPQPKKHHKRALSTRFGGCFEIDAGVNLSIGADASFFGLFNTGTSKSLFKKDFQIFKKCFGDQAKRSFWTLSKLDRPALALERRALGCPAKQNEAPEAVIDETVKGADIKAV